MASVTLLNLTKIYENDVTAVKNLNLQIHDGEFVVLVGPSGCGKSTLLRMIAGLESITEGSIKIDDLTVNDIPPKNRDIAMVFQNYALYPHMSVYENMAFGLKLRKIQKTEIEMRVKEAAEILAIEDLLDRKPKALSGGQRQRVAVGRAIVRKPKVFLFDEPLSNLDAKLRVQMRLEINRLYQRLKSTMIYVTHDQVEAMTMGSRIVVLREGFIQQVGSPLTLYNKPVNKFVAGFIGSPPMNFFEGELIRNNTLKFKSAQWEFELPREKNSKLIQYPHKEIIIGLRPEHLSDSCVLSDTAFSSPQTIRIDVVEPVGNEIFLYFRYKEQNYCMRSDPDRQYKSGQTLDIRFNLNKINFFDIKSEETIL